MRTKIVQDIASYFDVTIAEVDRLDSKALFTLLIAVQTLQKEKIATAKGLYTKVLNLNTNKVIALIRKNQST